MIPERVDHFPFDVLAGGLERSDGREREDAGEVASERGARRYLVAGKSGIGSFAVHQSIDYGYPAIASAAGTSAAQWPQFTAASQQTLSLVPPHPVLETDYSAEHHEEAAHPRRELGLRLLHVPPRCHSRSMRRTTAVVTRGAPVTLVSPPGRGKRH